MVTKTARRYAHALLQIAIEQDKLDKILADVQSIHQTIEESRELELFLKSPIIKPEVKLRALHSLFRDSVDSLTLHFLELVTLKGRERLLPQIMEGFVEQYKKHSGIIDVEVYSAYEMPEDQYEKLSRTLAAETGKRVYLKTVENPDLIGGLAVKIDDTVIDGTIKYKLDQLKILFKNSTVE